MMGIPKGESPVRGQGVNDIDPEGREPASAGWLMTVQLMTGQIMTVQLMTVQLMTVQAQASRRIRAGNALYLILTQLTVGRDSSHGTRREEEGGKAKIRGNGLTEERH